MKPYFTSEDFTLYHGDCCQIIKSLPTVDMIFADPPYFLSNGGLTINNGQIVSVNKGEWDKIERRKIDSFNRRWILRSKDILKDNGTIWVCGTMHNIYSIAKILEEVGFKILNTITWQKKNPPPNFSCRTFTHSTEFIIWARKESSKGSHYYNYELMKAINDGKQMKDVWTLSAISPWEKSCGKHPTQKPLSVVSRTILAGSRKGDLILDPFSGSSTTGISAILFGRRFIGIDIEEDYLQISIERRQEILRDSESFIQKIDGLDYGSVKELDK